MRRDESPIKGRRPVWFPEANAFVDTLVYDRAHLSVGDGFAGPAVIEEEGSTLVVPPRARFTVAPTGNVIVTLDP
jgi:N-methylhydantoinase A